MKIDGDAHWLRRYKCKKEGRGGCTCLKCSVMCATCPGEMCQNAAVITIEEDDDNPDDLPIVEYLSVGAIPEPTLLDVPVNCLDQWQLIKRMSQHFWSLWHKEYLSTLQSRNKWIDDGPNLNVGDLVFLKDDNQPILHLSRGRIVEIHPGADGKVRVASVTTSTSTFTRPVSKLVPLFSPKEDPEQLYDPPILE